jgi:hypothetical protein
MTMIVVQSTYSSKASAGATTYHDHQEYRADRAADVKRHFCYDSSAIEITTRMNVMPTTRLVALFVNERPRRFSRA